MTTQPATEPRDTTARPTPGPAVEAAIIAATVEHHSRRQMRVSRLGLPRIEWKDLAQRTRDELLSDMSDAISAYEDARREPDANT